MNIQYRPEGLPQAHGLYDPRNEQRPRTGPQRTIRGGFKSMAAQTGKRYTCPTCNSEFIVTKGGEGNLTCGDATALELKK